VEKGSSSMRTCCRNIHLRASDNTYHNSLISKDSTPCFILLYNWQQAIKHFDDTERCSAKSLVHYLLTVPLVRWKILGARPHFHGINSRENPGTSFVGKPSSAAHQHHESRFEKSRRLARVSRTCGTRLCGASANPIQLKADGSPTRDQIHLNF
jgi:hypothetical protein